MVSADYIIRTMSRDEINTAIEWAASEGWNPGLYDADCFYETDPEGFLVGELHHKPIATISAVKYGKTFGFLGFYIVKPAYRKQGYGLSIWNVGLNRLSGRNIGLDGVVAQQDNYKKSGFQLAYRNIRYEGISDGNHPDIPGIINISQVPFNFLERYDRPLFPDTRSQFLRSWLHQPDSVALGIMQDGVLSGYGMIRVCRSGYKIGPLFADNPKLAQSLFISLKSKVEPGQLFYFDVPEINQDAVSLAEQHHMKVVFETARMYKGVCPDLSVKKIFGVTTFELG